MVQKLPAAYAFDPADPRAPTHGQWEAMTPEERARVVDMLPTSLPLELAPPEGDAHRTAKQGALGVLDDFFRRAARRIYLSSELLVLYPDERPFAPDLLAVLDVEPRSRTRWVVDAEGRGLDLVIEVHVAGERAKDERRNVELYARLGIREYFFFDRARLALHGHRLAAGARAYERLVPQVGLLRSDVLGLDLGIRAGVLRFFVNGSPLEDPQERIARLGEMYDEVIAHKEDAERRADELATKLEDEQRRREDEQRRREDAERKLAAAEAEIARLKRGD